MMWWCSTLLLAVATAGIGAAQSSSLRPPVLPLIVRNPYLSTWLANAREEPWTRWPMFWTGEYIGFGVLASLRPRNSYDNSSLRTVYPLLGKPHDSLRYDDPSLGYNVSYPEYLGATYDASTTNLTYNLWTSRTENLYAKVVLSFMSPITPQSSLRQALPAAYFTVLVEGTTDIDIYVDLNGQWISGDRRSQLQWGFLHDDDDRITTNEMGSLKTWYARRASELAFSEINDRAEWGSLYFTGPSDVKHECGTSALLRQQFAVNGTLSNRIDNNFRSIMDEEPVFAFSKSFRLGDVSSSSTQKQNDSVMFTIAHVQDEVVQFASARGQTKMRPLWASWYTKAEKMLAFHYNDFQNAWKLAQNFSTQLANDAYASGGSNYVDILALSARQVLGATSFSGTPDDPLIFLKEISSNGNCQTVDVIFPSFPFFLYTNPRWGAYLLEPLIEHQLSGQYPNKYSMHDLGTHFPNQTGHADGRDEYMPVEECGDMLIMALSLVNSLQYRQADHAQSLWSAYGDATNVPVDAHGSAFPLSALDTVDGVPSMDDSWGGGAKGTRQAKLWVEKSFRMLEQWTGYLIEFSLEPAEQLSTDDFAGQLKLQTNLALKGIIGINAMSELAEVNGDHKVARYYKNISTTYVKEWEKFGMARDQHHAKLSYHWYGSWVTLYSLFSDALLCFHPSLTRNSTTFEDTAADFAQDHSLRVQTPEDTPIRESSAKRDFIPHHIYTNQSDFYSLVLQGYGLPLDSRHLWVKSDWEFFAAAVAEPRVRNKIIGSVAKWVNETSTQLPFTDLYWAEDDGGWPKEGPEFKARPVVGGHFAGLALARACLGR